MNSKVELFPLKRTFQQNIKSSQIGISSTTLLQINLMIEWLKIIVNFIPNHSIDHLTCVSNLQIGNSKYIFQNFSSNLNNLAQFEHVLICNPCFKVFKTLLKLSTPNVRIHLKLLGFIFLEFLCLNHEALFWPVPLSCFRLCSKLKVRVTTFTLETTQCKIKIYYNFNGKFFSFLFTYSSLLSRWSMPWATFFTLRL
jgi:hypothetical protein